MNWEEAIEKYADHKSLMAKSRDPTDVKRRCILDIEYLLKQIPELASRNINEITSEMWRKAINVHRKREGLNWDAIGDRSKGYTGKYFDLVRCLIFAKNNFTCRYCGRSIQKNPLLELQLEHIEPKSQTGDWFSLDNLGCACSFCNLGKQVMGENEFKKELIEIAKSVRSKFPKEFSQV